MFYFRCFYLVFLFYPSLIFLHYGILMKDHIKKRCFICIDVRFHTFMGWGFFLMALFQVSGFFVKRDHNLNFLKLPVINWSMFFMVYLSHFGHQLQLTYNCWFLDVHSFNMPKPCQSCLKQNICWQHLAYFWTPLMIFCLFDWHYTSTVPFACRFEKLCWYHFASI